MQLITWKTFMRALFLSAVFSSMVGNVWAREPSCDKELGAEAAAKLVRQCIMISPATHPPCNSVNPCRMIIHEIARGCAYAVKLKMYSKESAPFCEKYLWHKIQ